MRHKMTITTRAGAVFFVLFACATFVSLQFPTKQVLGILFDYSRTTPESALFVGDVMLARDVESRIADIGNERFFERVRPLHQASKYVIANFEASIPEEHVPTPAMTFSFSVDESLVSLLDDAQISHVSLANNHAFDNGEEGYENSFKVLTEASLTAFGHPMNITASSSSIITLDERKIGIVGIHSVWKEPSRDAIVEEMKRLTSVTDIQIVYIHWGNEYIGTHSPAQEEFAQFLVKSGADIIIGHHPHVIEDIQLVEGVPVFYSLGNYVFDQYWNTEVRTGLALRLSVERHAYVFDLIPIAIDRAQPRLMNDEEASVVLTALASVSDPALKTAIAAGSLRVSR